MEKMYTETEVKKILAYYAGFAEFQVMQMNNSDMSKFEEIINEN